MAIKKQIRITWAELNLICRLREISTDEFREGAQRKTFLVRLGDDEIYELLRFRSGDVLYYSIGDRAGEWKMVDDGSLYFKDVAKFPSTWCMAIPRDNPNRVARGVKDVGKKKPSLLPHKINNGGENVLVIGDLHAPFTKDKYLEFCQRIYKRYNCSQVVFIGDILDNHFSSFFDTDPDGHGAAEELRLAKIVINKFHECFPIAKVCLGNHDLIPERKRFNAGLSRSWVKGIDEVLNVEGWEFSEEFVINHVLYTHGTGRKAKQRCTQEFTSVVQGHYHSESYYETFVSEYQLMFALQVGCGVDRKQYAMAYGKHFKKPQINVGVVMDNGRWALIEHMVL